LLSALARHPEGLEGVPAEQVGLEKEVSRLLKIDNTNGFKP
jgi:hypothetical protein